VKVTDEISLRKYDLYLLMDIDFPWDDDPLRDFPNEREHFMKVWKKELSSIEANYSIVSGLENQRLENGLKAVKSFLINQ
jgi:nicotinamide riboside kinase